MEVSVASDAENSRSPLRLHMQLRKSLCVYLHACVCKCVCVCMCVCVLPHVRVLHVCTHMRVHTLCMAVCVSVCVFLLACLPMHPLLSFQASRLTSDWLPELPTTPLMHRV